ncbi:hypothetical protein [Halorussus halobius]|uniref:hypothetical protein n=1 Tax=Halorussus halobius TaxID=1710537 RepID=UPI00143DB9F3|nr:hypothetical protein [Halorussus halobius]
MSQDITASLEAEYEPEHDETDEQIVVGTSCPESLSVQPACMNSPDDELQF